MFNRQRTLEVFGYDLDPNKLSRRSNKEFQSTGLKKDIKVIDNCPSCNAERQISLRSSRKNKSCLKCFHNSSKMIEAKKNQSKIKSEETKQKMRDNHWSKVGTIGSLFKGKTHTPQNKELLSQKQYLYMDGLSASEKRTRYIKSSRSYLGISEQDFDGWATEEALRIRCSKIYKDWEKAVYQRDKHCQFPGCLERRRAQLTAHHKDGFNWAVDKRFDVDNGVLLCKYHHNTGPNSFHSKYGNGDNTKAQFDEWIGANSINAYNNRDLYLVTGPPGIGKSWVCTQLVELFDYIPYDDVPKEQHLHLMLKDDKRPILYDPWRKATSFKKRYGSIFNIKLIVILEDLKVLEDRLRSRGGTPDSNTERYHKRAISIAKDADFKGTSQEVLDFLKANIKRDKIES
jgi:hypothetical protein